MRGYVRTLIRAYSNNDNNNNTVTPANDDDAGEIPPISLINSSYLLDIQMSVWSTVLLYIYITRLQRAAFFRRH